MKFLSSRAVALIAALAALSIAAQTAPAPQTTTQQPANPEPHGKVIFSRSTDENGKTTIEVGPGAIPPAIQMASEPSAEDTERQAVTVTALNLDVHLHTASHQIAVRAQVTVRNDGKSPLARIPLQISSSLNWEQIRITGKNITFSAATLNSDTDHTGQLHEAAVPLAQPLAPGATLQLDVAYSGAIVPSSQRLTTIGTPADVALHSDWDEISDAFTGLRGFGNVVWYPVSSVPVILGDGARLFDEIGRHKLHLSGAHFTLHLTVEFPHGEPPTVALVNGLPVSLAVADAHGLDADLEGVATASVENATLGFEAPSLFVAERNTQAGSTLIVRALPDNEASAPRWIAAAAAVEPFVESWLGPHSQVPLTVLDLPDPQDAPYETGAMLAASLTQVPTERLEGVLVHALTHTHKQSRTRPDLAWLNEGLATFMESLWVEKRHGRDQALQMLESDRAALALAEPPSPGESAGTPLADATAPIYYRTKAAYVLWMLRDLISDQALSATLRAYDSESVDSSGSATSNPQSPLQKLLKQAGVIRDLSWFFSDWVDADKGLPDLSIQSAFSAPSPGGTVLVAVNVANAGYAAAEVPVTVRTAHNSVTERALVPARGRVIHRILVVGPPTEVQVNDGSVPETQASMHVTSMEDAQSPQPAPGTSSSGQEPPPQ